MTKAALRRNISAVAITLALLAGVGYPACASASPVLGQQIYYEGGNISGTVLPYDAGYTSNLYFFAAGGPILVANSSQVGRLWTSAISPLSTTSSPATSSFSESSC